MKNVMRKAAGKKSVRRKVVDEKIFGRGGLVKDWYLSRWGCDRGVVT